MTSGLCEGTGGQDTEKRVFNPLSGRDGSG